MLRERPSAERPADESLAVQDERARLRAAVESLPEDLRRVVMLCEYSELTYDQIAEMLAIPVGTVGSRRNRALRRLRETLSSAPRVVKDMPERLFDTLEPPAGGLAGLRGRIARDTRRRATMRRLQAATAAMVVVGLVGWAGVAQRRQVTALPAQFDLVRMNLGLLPPPSEVLTIRADQRGNTAVHRVPLPTDEVVFYLVGSISE